MGEQNFRDLVEELEDLSEKPLVYDFDGQYTRNNGKEMTGRFYERKSHGAYDGLNED